MTSTPVTLVFTPGAWHTPECFEAVIDLLRRANPQDNFITVSLPSVNCPRNSPSMNNWQPDIDAVHSAISSALNITDSTGAKTNVVAISHSYGSLVTNEALGAVPASDHSRLKHIILCGFIIPQGSTIRGPPERPFPPLWDVQGDIVYANDPAAFFYQDLPSEDQEKWAGKLKGTTMPLAAYTNPVQHAAWKSIPTTYVFCEDDQAIPAAKQAGMLAGCSEEGGSLRVKKLKSGHSPFLSVPEQVAEIIGRVSSGGDDDSADGMVNRQSF